MLLLVFVFAAALLAPAENFPAFRWIQQVGGTGMDTFAGLAVDAQGNTFVAGTTSSPNFPVQSAAQSTLASAGIYRIQGSSYSRIAANRVVRSLTADPSNASVLYGVSSGSAVKSIDGGNTWSTLAIPSAQIESLAVDPVNDLTVYAAAFDTGAYKSADGGATWAAIDNGLTVCSDCSLPTGSYGAQRFWIDPNSPNVVFLFYANSIARSADGGASWQNVSPTDDQFRIYFDTGNPGVLYLFTFHDGALKSTDDGQTFQSVSLPVSDIFADPRTPGRLLGDGAGGIFESDDDGATWTLRLQYSGMLEAADWMAGLLYAAMRPSGITAISTDLSTITPIGPATISGLALVESAGIVYAPGSGDSNAFVAKLDPSGNVIFATYFGGSSGDNALAVAVDASGSVYVTGNTLSSDFPVTKDAYATSGSAFLFKLNPDGSLAYSTYFPAGQSTPTALAADASGAAYITGSTFGGVPTTPGAYKTICGCYIGTNGFFSFVEPDGFVTKFDPTGSTLLYSTYLGVPNLENVALALAPDTSAYISGSAGIYHLNSTGSALVASAQAYVQATAIALAPDGSVYAAGSPEAQSFPVSANAFQTAPVVWPSLPAQGAASAEAIVRLDSQLQNVLAATYFGGAYGTLIHSLAVDASGNLYAAGLTAPRGLPTRTPLVEAFGPQPGTGFAAEFSADLSTLLFSTYLGDAQYFAVQSIALAPDGSAIAGGTAGNANNDESTNVWINSIAAAPPPLLRIDSILNAASLLDGAISPGETIVLRGSGFSGNSTISIGGESVAPIASTASQLTAIVPADLSTGAAVQIETSGSASNTVAVPVDAASPGLFSADGSGLGQGYILNQDGTLNTPSNPARQGTRITIYATGAGPLSIANGYAVTASPVSVFIDGVYCDGVAATVGAVSGFPGQLYQLTVIVPSFDNFLFPPLVGIVLEIAGSSSQNGLALSIAP